MSYTSERVNERIVMSRADLVLLEHGHPLVVVEAKARPTPNAFESSVLAQLRYLASKTGSRWSLLADPQTVRVYRDQEPGPVAEIATREIMRAVGLTAVDAVGKGVLLIALDRWFKAMAGNGKSSLSPALSDFAHAVQDADETVREFVVD